MTGKKGLLDPDVVWVAGGWERRDYPTMMSGWVVRYTVNHHTPEEMQISASREKVTLHRVDIRMSQEGARFVDIVKRAWRQHEHLRKDVRNRPLSEMDAAVGGTAIPCELKNGEQAE